MATEISGGFKILAVAQKIPSSLSVLGAIMIISSVLRNKKNRKLMQKRLVCVMSFVDLAVSLVWVATNLLMLKENTTYPGTIGNEFTCKLQGAIVQFSIASVIYNGCLSIYYLLIIKFEWKEQRAKKLEGFMHFFSLMFGLGTSITALSLDLYHPADWDCWIAPTAAGEKVELANSLRWFFFFGPLWVSIFVSCVAIITIYLHVQGIEKKTVENSDNVLEMEKTKSVAAQGKLYIIAFLITWMFPTIARILQLFNIGVPMWMVVAAGTIIPSNGFFNSLVYFRIRYLKIAKANPSKSKFWAFSQIVRTNLCCGTSQLDPSSNIYTNAASSSVAATSTSSTAK